MKATKPLIDTKGNAPFYDPDDIHVHIWKYGKISSEEDPKKINISSNKLFIKECFYCKICHTIQNKFESNVFSLRSNSTITNNDNYIIDNKHTDEEIIIEDVKEKEEYKIDLSHDKIFHKDNNNYDKVMID